MLIVFAHFVKWSRVKQWQISAACTRFAALIILSLERAIRWSRERESEQLQEVLLKRDLCSTGELFEWCGIRGWDHERETHKWQREEKRTVCFVRGCSRRVDILFIASSSISIGYVIAQQILYFLCSLAWLSRPLSFGVLSRPRARIKYKTLETCCAVCEWVNKFIFTAPAEDVACEGSGYSLAAHATGSVWVLFPKCPQTPFLQAFTKILSALHFYGRITTTALAFAPTSLCTTNNGVTFKIPWKI
jgi:hypothetical protein